MLALSVSLADDAGLSLQQDYMAALADEMADQSAPINVRFHSSIAKIVLTDVVLDFEPGSKNGRHSA